MQKFRVRSLIHTFNVTHSCIVSVEDSFLIQQSLERISSWIKGNNLSMKIRKFHKITVSKKQRNKPHKFHK